MGNLKKIDRDTNVLTWFEIPIQNTERAKTFYETILNIEMTTILFEESGEELTFFPFDPDVIQATSGRVTGVLSKSKLNSPSTRGTLVYINASPTLRSVLDRIEKAGGKILVPETRMHFGSIAIMIDSEGNRVGLHAEY